MATTSTRSLVATCLRVLRRAALLAPVLAALASPAAAEPPPGALHLGGASKVGVVLAHGQGLGPDSQVVGPLRKALHEKAGYQTLSLRLPVVLGKHSPTKYLEYEPTFPEAYRIIQAGIDFLRKEQGVERVYVVGYSMGARMATGFLAANPDSGVVGFVGVGMLGGGDVPVNTNLNLRRLTLPILDVHGDTDPDARSAAARSALASRMTVVVIPGAGHDYSGHETNVVEAVIPWLQAREAP